MNASFSHARIPKPVAWLCLLACFSVLNETIFNVSLPDIAADFGIAPSAANWINTGFILTFAIGTSVYGKLSDVYGARKLLLFGLLLYGAGSCIGALLHASYPAVLLARLTQGAGISAVPALLMTVVARYVAPEHRGKAFGLIGSAVACGEGLGPVIGGLTTGYLHWHLLFLIPLATLLTIPFFLRTLPAEPPSQTKMDVVGALCLSAGITAFTLFTTAGGWQYLAAALPLFGGFMVRIRYAAQPFVEPALLRNVPFAAGVLAGSILLGTVAGYVSMVPYMMKALHHMPTSLIGIGILFPGTASVILFGMAGGVLSDKRGKRLTMIAGLGLIAAGFGIVSFWADRTPWLITGATILAFGGLSFVKTVISASVAGTLGPEQTGSGMGLLNLVCFLGEGIGVAAVGGLLTGRSLSFPLLPTVIDASAFLYSNLALVLIAAALFGGVLYGWVRR